MNNITQALETMFQQAAEERSRTQMTLGQLIDRLSQLNQDTELSLGKPHSYRGYYSDLAFEPSEARKVVDVLLDAEQSLGKTFVSYKGGEFVMTESTPIWVAFYGECGERLMAINDDGTILSKEEEC